MAAKGTGLILRSLVALLAVAAVAMTTACGGGSNPGIATAPPASPMSTPFPTASGTPSPAAYAACMRAHGIADFPDPNSQGNFEINAGPGSDLDPNNPAYQAANQACQSLLPGGGQAPPISSQKLSQEVAWAQCMRSHGLPTFPDPDSAGAFDSSKFNEASPGFQTASQACKSLTPSGGMAAVPGKG